MTVYSKQHLVASFTNLGCEELVHPWTHRCDLCFLDMLSCSLRGTYKFFLVMYLVQLVLKGRKITKEYLQGHVLGILRSTLFGVLAITTTLRLSCWLRWVLGRYYYYSLIFIPGMIGAGITIFVESPTRRTLYTFTFIQMCVEYWLRVLGTSGSFALTRGRQTFIFMCSNAILLYLLKTDATKKQSYWFFRPSRSEQVGFHPKTGCTHSGSCWKFTLTNASKYMGIGLGIQFLRILLTKSRLLLREPKSTLKDFLSSKNTFELGSFLGAYIGIYTCVSCFLCRHDHGDSDLHAVPAGFLAGSAYWLHPNRTIGASAITNALQLLLRRGISAQVVSSLPYFVELLFALSSAVLFHARFLDRERCPSFIVKTVSTATRGRTDYIYGNLEQILNKVSHTMS